MDKPINSTINLNSKELYINRELSWLKFNMRVLNEAKSPSNPLFERMKFLSIVSSNLDEFFMVRVSSIRDQILAGYDKMDISGFTPQQIIDKIAIQVKEMVGSMYNLLQKEIMPDLYKNGIKFLDVNNLTSAQGLELDIYFDEVVYPVLTPMAVDSSRPFPQILNRSLNLGVLLEGTSDEYEFATIQVPSVLSRVMYLSDNSGKSMILLEDVIARRIDDLFHGRRVICCYPYRITRNADLTLDEEGAEDLLVEVEKSLKRRMRGAAIRLEFDYRALNTKLIQELGSWLELSHGSTIAIKGPIDLDFLMKDLYVLSGYERLKYNPYAARELDFNVCDSIFDRMTKGDILLYHPYDSFNPVVRFVKEASQDSNVLAIKQTLYRVSGHSPIIKALEEAAEAGKQVTVLVELKARFDEENNIHWVKQLEEAGAHVIYGLVGLKVHSKITLVVRREENGIKRYVHLGTGNYNDETARIYTDHSLFTKNELFGADASAFFNMLTGFSELPELNKLVTAPKDLRKTFAYLIEREIKNAQEGHKAELYAKMNSLVDPEIIELLYKASMAGVKIRVIVRGICCLRPGVTGISDNIQVRSIVGRFLEHSRFFCFLNSGKWEVYLSSADWMPRNLDRRVELLFPVEDKVHRESLLGLFKLQWRDTVKSSQLKPDGSYEHVIPKGEDSALNSQEELMNM